MPTLISEACRKRRRPIRTASSKPPRPGRSGPRGPRLLLGGDTRGRSLRSCLVLPLMLAYELGVLWQGGASATALRTGADAWMRHLLASMGLTDQWLLPLILVLILLGWQVASPRDWRFSPSILVGMILESCVLAIALVGISRLIDMGFSLLDQNAPPVLSVVHPPLERTWLP